MHQTISGVTHKDVKLNFDSNNFLEKETLLYRKLFDLKSKTIYENTKTIKDHVLNYLNVVDNNPQELELKKIIRTEFDKCEKIYPYMGDLLLEIFFKNKSIKRYSNLYFNKKNEKDFISSLKNSHVRQISKIIFDNISLEYFIDIKKEKIDQITMIKKDSLNFDLEFDNDYFDKNDLIIDNYNVVIIDGIIDTVGEIHHLLYEASENKENYVIFCYGVNDEVKHTIINNNKRKITKVFPIDLNVCEETLNILNDIAVIHDEEVISALKGQTISQSIRKKLSKGKRIKIGKNLFTIEKKCSESDYNHHKNFISNRIIESTNETNKKYLEKRYKRLNSKTMTIVIPEAFINDNSFVRELDYLIRFIGNINKKMIKIKNINNKKYYYIPEIYYNSLKLKSQEMKEIFKKIKTVITNHRK